ncbi:sensor histidine kinase [Chitinophaga ginsengisoli]|uniref:Histidine kinase n=1 Tax=Chitinophaga ginsengisoli TaxID=363837 RepID=A0A2P8GM47_9BACT|nr:sensor histidine kinase [Chitinophaga ginsengisoli]PSL35044.1 histidine kinase [Chitinophaga ginsengisoli]
MNELTKRQAWLVGHLDVWLFGGMLIWISILELRPENWKAFLMHVGISAIIQIPAFVFSWNRMRWLQQLTSRRYLLYWLFSYGVCLPLITALCIVFKPGDRSVGSLVTVAICCISLELILSALVYYQQRGRHVGWVNKISLDKAVLVSLLLIAITLSVMAVSSMDNPRYHTKEQLLIGYEFDGYKILTRPGLFLGFIAQFMFMYLCAYLLYYINSRFLVAKVLKQKGMVIYIMSVFALMAFLYPVLSQLLAVLPINKLLGGIFSENPFLLENAFGGLAVIFLTLPIVLALQWAKQNNRIVSLEKEKTRAELDLLKQQLDPHFFFNTLNNLYALSLQQSKQTPESILQLSELMRYVIYKGNEATVPIREEIKYIADYMQLQRIRSKIPLDLQFIQHISDESQPVAPMLLIVFIENAFKHGIEPSDGPALLHLQLTCTDRQLYFSCENSFEGGITSATGIGLDNLQKRLALLYPGRHVLKTAVKNYTFKAEMQLDFS